MVVKIPYSLMPGLESTGVLAPMLPVTFSNNGYEFSTFALVDSGAYSGLISTIIADELGIDWQKLPRHTGFTASGSFTFRVFKDLEIDIYDHRYCIDINIVEGINAFKCILGRNDLFKKAKITFEGYKNEFQIEFKDFN